MRVQKSVLIATVLLAVGVALYWFARNVTSPGQGRDTSAKPLVVGIATWPGFAPGFAAQAVSLFGDLKVDFRVIDDFSARQAAFVSGSTDLTIGTIDSFAFDLAKGIPGTVILVLDQSFGADGIVVSPSIKETSDLRGRKVAYTRGSPAHFFLVNVLRDAKLTVNDIQSVQVDNPDVAAQAFIAGSVDAAVTWEPHISEIVNSGKGRLMESTSLCQHNVRHLSLLI